MVSSRPPEGETERVAALDRYGVLDTPPEEPFDDLALLAAQAFRLPIALIGFVDVSRVWYKARIGLELTELPREGAFCNQVILDRCLLVIPDALADERFRRNPLVVSDPRIRFFAGAPLVSPEGHAVGTICVMDRTPHEPTPEER
ncbi:MAG: GAF domain-containing protein, partial [Thermoanaerobaculia bacterium]